jgi:hypothetical protein
MMDQYQIFAVGAFDGCIEPLEALLKTGTRGQIHTFDLTGCVATSGWGSIILRHHE